MDALTGAFMLAVLVYEVAMVETCGRTLGKHALGIIVVDADRLQLVGTGQSVGRLLMLCIPVVNTLGLLWMLFDRRRQGFHDKAAGTVVMERDPAAGRKA